MHENSVNSSTLDLPNSLPAENAGERAAVLAVLEGTTLERWQLGAKALASLMRNPNDTKQALIMSTVSALPSYPRFLAEFCRFADGDRLIRERPTIDSKHVDYERLRALPATTLGGAYARHLHDNGLDPDIFQAPPGLDGTAGYVSQRMRQCHDVWHAITGYASDVEGESAILAFSYGQTRVPGPGLISLAATIRKSHGTWARQNLEAYRRGRDADFIGSVYWEARWEQDLEDLRHEFNIRPAKLYRN